MPAALALVTVAVLLAQGTGASLLSLPSTFPNITACASETSVYSCENTTAIANTCCSPTPGGLVLQTQFWDTYTGYEHQGQLLPKDSWTIHGLWPDNCDGLESCFFHREDLRLTYVVAVRMTSTAISRVSMTPTRPPPSCPTVPRSQHTRAPVWTPLLPSSGALTSLTLVRLSQNVTVMGSTDLICSEQVLGQPGPAQRGVLGP